VIMSRIHCIDDLASPYSVFVVVVVVVTTNRKLIQKRSIQSVLDKRQVDIRIYDMEIARNCRN